MTSFTVAWRRSKLLQIAFVSSILIGLGACKSTNIESLTANPTAKKHVEVSDKRTASKTPGEPALPGGVGPKNKTAKASEVAKPTELETLLKPVRTGKSEKRVWGTVYYIQAAKAYSGRGGVSLRSPGGKPLGTILSVNDFCRAAREGTVAVNGGREGTFNHAGWTDLAQTDCSKVFPRVARDEVARFERTVFAPVPSDAPEGLGSDSRYRLVPYRTVAVDKSVFPLGSVLFIPKLKGRKTPVGAHDGYVFAGDTGVGVIGPHLDFFLGRSMANPAPDVFAGGPSTRFNVELVTDPAVIQRLRRQHLR
jgi:hypothetical protein